MVVEVLGEVLPSALAVALSPFPVVAVILVLGSPRARTSGPAFALGWVLGLTVLSVIVVTLAADAEDPDSAAATGVGWIELALGLGLVFLAARKWRNRPGPGDEVVMPGWMTGMEDVGTPRALGLGLLLGGANPKNVALTVAAMAAVAEVGADGGDTGIAIGTFVLLGSATVLGAVLAHLVLGERAAAPLTAVKDFMATYNAVIMIVILLVFGAKLVGDGVADIVR